MARTLPSETVRTPARQFAGPSPAKVLRVTSGALYVELDAVPGLEIGPVKWGKPATHTHSDPDGATGANAVPNPPAGTRCLILFAGEGIADPWLGAWSGWPA